jgi:hypothetical protein
VCFCLACRPSCLQTFSHHEDSISHIFLCYLAHCRSCQAGITKELGMRQTNSRRPQAGRITKLYARHHKQAVASQLSSSCSRVLQVRCSCSTHTFVSRSRQGHERTRRAFAILECVIWLRGAIGISRGRTSKTIRFYLVNPKCLIHR